VRIFSLIVTKEFKRILVIWETLSRKVQEKDRLVAIFTDEEEDKAQIYEEGLERRVSKGEEHMTETIGTASVTLIRENEDGSADYQFNFPPEALEALTRLGILTALQAGIEDAKRLNPEEDDDRQDN
jgi:hypothetical protein